MPGLIMNGIERPVHGRTVLNWRDDRRLRLRYGEDCGARPDGVRVQCIVAHTTLGEAGGLEPGVGPDAGKELRVAEWWSTSRRKSGAHLVVDLDGSIACLSDLNREQAFHASGPINRRAIGCERSQGRRKECYEEQVRAEADLYEELCRQFGIQRVIPDAYRGPIPRLASGGSTFVGVVGHRDCTDDRDRYDPGEYIFDELARRGFRRLNVMAGDDLAFWRDVQRSLGVAESGVPGRATVRALREAGHEHGLLADDWKP